MFILFQVLGSAVAPSNPPLAGAAPQLTPAQQDVNNRNGAIRRLINELADESANSATRITTILTTLRERNTAMANAGLPAYTAKTDPIYLHLGERVAQIRRELTQRNSQLGMYMTLRDGRPVILDTPTVTRLLGERYEVDLRLDRVNRVYTGLFDLFPRQ